MSRHDETRRGVIRLLTTALEAASTADELLDCAVAAAAVADPELSGAVAGRVGDAIAATLESSDAWRMTATYSKGEAWLTTGHKARVLAEAWGLVGQSLDDQPG